MKSPRLKKIVKRATRWLLIVGVCIVLFLVCLPLWFPVTARLALSRCNVEYDSVKMSGYKRLVLEGVQYRSPSILVVIGHADIAQPVVWGWSCIFKPKTPASADRLLVCKDWSIVINETGTEPRTKPATDASAHAVYEDIRKYSELVNKWAHSISFRNGALHAGANKVIIPELDLLGGRLSGKAVIPGLDQSIEFTGRIADESVVEAHVDPLGLNAELKAQSISNVLNTELTASLGPDQISCKTSFSKNGVVPVSGKLDAPRLRIPETALRIPGFSEPALSLNGNWLSNSFDIDLSFAAKTTSLLPVADSTVTAALQANGDLDEIEITAVDATLGGSRLSLDAPLVIDLNEQYIAKESSINLALALSDLSIQGLDGVVLGKTSIKRAPLLEPEIALAASATNLTAFGMDIHEFNISADANRNTVDIKDCAIQMAGESSVTTEAKLDLRTLSVADGSLVGGLTPDAFKGVLPANINFEKAIINTEFEGPLKSIRHHGELRISQINYPPVKPLDFATKWNGIAAEFENLDASIKTTNATILVQAAGVVGNGISSSIKRFEVSTDTNQLMRLTTPAGLVIGNSGAHGFSGELTNFNLAGSDSALSLNARIQWPDQAEVKFDSRQLSDSFLKLFITNNLPLFEFNELSFNTKWDNGPADWGFHAKATFSMPPIDQASAGVDISGGAGGLRIDEITLSTPAGQILSAQGLAPVVFNPASSNLFHVYEEHPLKFTADIKSVPLQSAVKRLSGVQLESPRFNLDMSGTPASPTGKLSFNADAAVLSDESPKLPDIGSINLTAAFDEKSAKIERCTVMLADTPLRLNAEQPLGSGYWSALTKGFKPPDWRAATGSLEFQGFAVSNIVSLAPEVLSPQGRLDLSAELHTGGEITGALVLTNLSTRPIPPLAPVQDLHGTVVLKNRRMELEELSGSLGGSRFQVSGFAEHTEDGAAAFSVNLLGTNLPLAQAPGMILRGDPNITVTQTSSAPAEISGVLNLHDCMFLSDLKSLVSGGVASPTRRPPYFSITAPPLNEWRLDLEVKGDEFIRVKNPFFIGVASADFDLSGTLEEPVALGEVKLDSGVINFPFANIQIKQGLIMLTLRDPYRPQLNIQGESRCFGYNIKLDVSGDAEQPAVKFSSTPPLSSEEILLMITAGEIPNRSGFTTRGKQTSRIAMFLGKSLLSDLGFGGGSDRLVIRSGEDISTEGRETYYIEYMLSDKWSLIGEYDRFGNLNAGLKWNVLSK
ncbi:MAG: translocation/assembly module TamB [Verrucomicrobia bacterium]|nr:translocation/assembly module TamB [Verrucomicrobiota bacterium]